MKILHLADIHAEDENLEEIQKCCGKVLETAKEERPELIVIAGDVYNKRDIQLDSNACKFIFSFVADLAEIATVAIVTGTPYHEGKATESLIYASTFEHNAIVSLYPEQLILAKGQLFPVAKYLFEYPPDALISMIPTPTKQYMQGTNEDVSNAMTGLFAGFGATAHEYECPHIIIGHFSVRGASINDTQVMIGREIEIGKDQITMADADLTLLGHIHKAQEIEPNIYYAGSIYRKDFGETEDKGFYIHEIHMETENQPYATMSRFIKTPTRRLLTVREDYTLGIKAELEIPPLNDFKGAKVKYEIKLYQDQAETYDKDLLEKQITEAGATSVDIRIIRVPRETVRSENLIHLDTLRDKIKEMAALKGEEVTESILNKADQLETQTEDEILTHAANGYHDEQTSTGISGS